MSTLIITTEEYTRTASGKSWRTTPDSTETQALPWDRRDVAPEEPHGEETHRLITEPDTLKWFRRLGGSESATYGYTRHGYIVTRLVSTSPDRQNRTVRKFRFEEETTA